jgi:Zn-dependent M28 family amino/carboxypeptidase
MRRTDDRGDVMNGCKRPPFAALLLLATTAGCASSQGGAYVRPVERRPPAEAGVAAITAEGLLADIRELASDRFLGRGVATAGEDSTVAYLSRRFREMGLRPGMPDGSYEQRVPLVATTSRVEARVNAGGRTLPLRQLEEVVAWSQRPDAEVAVNGAEMVFVGYGVVAPELGWDDFKGVDVRGKTVVMLVGDPPVPDPADSTRLDPSVFRGAAMTYYGRWTYKYDIAAERGAAAVLLVHQTGPAGYPWSVVQGNVRERFEVEGATPHVPVEGWIQLEAARAVFAAGGHDFAALERAARTREFRPVALGGTATFGVRNTVRRVQSRNVVARIDGSDPSVSDEAVLFTSHWDSFGVGRAINGDSIYNGALDDASGVAWMLSVAGAVRAMGNAPRRTLVFVAFTAEEAGLLGARWYATHPVVPLDKTLADINMDAMNPWGRTRSIVSLGYGQSSLEDVLMRHAVLQGRTVVADPEPEKGYFYRADHLELARGGVPALSFLFPGTDYRNPDPGYGEQVRGAYIRDDYHKPTDEVKPDWDMSGIVEDTQLLLHVGLEVANGNAWPTWSSTSEFRSRRERVPPPAAADSSGARR